MTWFTDIQGWFVTTESEVVALLVQIKQGVTVAENDINNAIRWVANNAPAIAADIQQVLAVVQTLGIVNPEVTAAIAAANAAIVAINAFAAAEKAGQSNVQSVVSGYVAVKQAQSAAASAAAAAAQAPVNK